LKRSFGIPRIVWIVALAGAAVEAVGEWLCGPFGSPDMTHPFITAAILLGLAEPVVIGRTWDTPAWTSNGRALAKFLLVLGAIVSGIGLVGCAALQPEELPRTFLISCAGYGYFFLAFIAGRAWQRRVSAGRGDEELPV
jgi:hypothetical protein